MKRVARSWYDFLPFPMIMTFILVSIGQTLAALGMMVIRLKWGVDFNSGDAMITASMYASFIGVWIVFLLAIILPGDNRPILKTIGPGMRGNTIGMLLLGFVLGFILNGFCVLMAIFSQDISIYFDRFSPLSVLIIFILVFIQSSAEELACRGYLYQRLCRRYNAAVAIIGNSALFALLHIMNPGVTLSSLLDIFITGILFSLLVYYFDSLWCAMALHAMWNFTQNIIFGLPNSGQVVPFSIFKLDAASARDGLFYTVNFGVEGSWGSVILLGIVTLILLVIGLVRRMQPTRLWEIIPDDEIGEAERKKARGCLIAVIAAIIIMVLIIGGFVVGGNYILNGLTKGTITFRDLGIEDGEQFLKNLGIENGSELFPPETFGKPKQEIQIPETAAPGTQLIP